jgi:hypothetical protein
MFLDVLDCFLVVSRHLKATDPDVRAIKRDCARAVYSYYGFAKAAWPGDAKRLRVFPKVLCMGHFFVDTAMFGGAHGFSAYAWESPQGLFSRKAFERSSGRYGEECAVYYQWCVCKPPLHASGHTAV